MMPIFRPYHQFHYHAPDDREGGLSPGQARPHGKGFTIIAHRGASAYFPENTLASFAGAIGMKADMVEFDVQLTSDGEVVVFHDEKINRTTDGRGRIAGHSLARLKVLDAGGWFDEKFRGEKIPTLAEALNFCRGRIAVNIEVKTEAVTDRIGGGIEEKCLKEVERAGMRQHVVFSSFDPRAVCHLREIDPEAPAAVLFEKKYYGTGLASRIVETLGACAFNCSRRELTAKRLADLAGHGIPVNVYTIDAENQMQRLLALGVDGIFTNYPDVLWRVLMDFRRVQPASS